jgi:outer membrane immunogenic protein
MKRIVLAALCATALVSTADAADLAARAPMYTKAPAAQVYDWTGFYIGGNVGYAHNHMSASDETLTQGGVATQPAVGGSSDGNGFTGGGQIGYNYQLGQTVLGVEGDFNYIGAKDSTTFNPAGGPISETSTFKSDWFATIRGRVGYTFGAFMPYLTGGVAFMHTTANVTLSAAGVPLGFNASDDHVAVGYAVGAGLEYAIDKNWSIRGEYLHMGFGGQDYDGTGDLTMGGATASIGAHAHVKSDYDIARIGVNYRFH